MERKGNVWINRTTCVWQGKEELEMKAIKRQVENESQGELWREKNVKVDAEAVETDFGTV